MRNARFITAILFALLAFVTHWGVAHIQVTILSKMDQPLPLSADTMFYGYITVGVACACLGAVRESWRHPDAVIKIRS